VYQNKLTESSLIAIFRKMPFLRSPKIDFKALRAYAETRGYNLDQLRKQVPISARDRFDRMVQLLSQVDPQPSHGYEAWGLPRIAFTAEFLSVYAKHGCRVLDLASGSVFSLLLSDSLRGVTWVPTDGEFAEKQFKCVRTEDLVYDYQPIPLMIEPKNIDLPKVKQDIVTLFEVVEHFPWNPGPLFGAISDSLEIGGRFILSTPNLCGRSSILRQLKGGTPFQCPFFDDGLWFHKKEYAPWELKKLLKWAGFTVETLKTTNVYREPRGWSAWVHHAALCFAAGLSFSPVELRHLLLHFGSTQFLVARNSRPVQLDVPPPSV
jgi:SAM-dependent methyltransferase